MVLDEIETLLGNLAPGQSKVAPETLFSTMSSICDCLGNPQDHKSKYIHIAGTNGKGSIASFLDVLLRSQGYSVNLYTSPHIKCLTERIKLGGQQISEEVLLRYLRHTLDKVNDIPINYFQALTATAFQIFRDCPADFTILETGMGGRCDSTNVISNPFVCIISPIGFDHQQFLGNTLADITYEKLGIVKTMESVFIAKQLPEVIGILKTKQAQSKNSFYFYAEDWSYELKDKHILTVTFNTRKITIPLPENIFGYQVENLSMVLGVMLANNLIKGKESISEVIKAFKYTGRLSKFKVDDTSILIDGAHNLQGIQALRVVCFDDLGYKPKNTAVIFTTQRRNNLSEILQELSFMGDILIFPKMGGSYTDCSVLADIAERLNIKYRIEYSLEDALSGSIRKLNNIIITGSLYSIDATTQKISNFF